MFRQYRFILLFIFYISFFQIGASSPNLFAQPYQVSNGESPGLPKYDFAFNGENDDDFKIGRSTVNEVHAFTETNLAINHFMSDEGFLKNLFYREVII